jgi:hypothetical protein
LSEPSNRITASPSCVRIRTSSSIVYVLTGRTATPFPSAHPTPGTAKPSPGSAAEPPSVQSRWWHINCGSRLFAPQPPQGTDPGRPALSPHPANATAGVVVRTTATSDASVERRPRLAAPWQLSCRSRVPAVPELLEFVVFSTGDLLFWLLAKAGYCVCQAALRGAERILDFSLGLVLGVLRLAEWLLMQTGFLSPSGGTAALSTRAKRDGVASFEPAELHRQSVPAQGQCHYRNRRVQVEPSRSEREATSPRVVTPEDRCKVCGRGLADEYVKCPTCRSSHHSACWASHGGCGADDCPGVVSGLKLSNPRRKSMLSWRRLPRPVPWHLKPEVQLHAAGVNPPRHRL